MKGRPIIQKQIKHLNEQQYKKLFPEEYYRKYATHIAILDFQNHLFRHPLPNKPTSLFLSRKRATSQPLLQKGPKLKLNRYDLVADTIQKNRQETMRMQKFVSNLNRKLKVGTFSKSSKTIRSPITGFQQLNQAVIDKMRYIENQEYETELQKMRAKKFKDIQYVKFKKRSYNSTSQIIGSNLMQNSIIADSAASRSIKSIKDDLFHHNMSNTMELHPMILIDSATKERLKNNDNTHLTYKQRLQKLIQHAKSQIVSINPEDKHGSVKYIMAMNRSIKKINGLKECVSKQKLRMMGANGSGIIQKRMTTFGSNSSQQKKVNLNQNNVIKLMQRNKGVRDIGNKLQVLSRYQNLMRQRQLQSFLRPM